MERKEILFNVGIYMQIVLQICPVTKVIPAVYQNFTWSCLPLAAKAKIYQRSDNLPELILESASKIHVQIAVKLRAPQHYDLNCKM